MRTIEELIDKVRTATDDELVMMAVMMGVTTPRSQQARDGRKVMAQEVRKRRLGGTVERFVTAAKEEGERQMAQSVTSHLPDGSAVIRMPNGGKITSRLVERKD